MNTLQEFEEHRINIKAQIERRDAIKRLSENADFRKIIREGFMVEDCARYVRESINPMIDAEGRADALGFAQAAGYLKNFLNIEIQKGDVAEGQLLSVEQAMDEIRAEEIEED